MSTHSSREINSAYFTGLHEARQLLKKADGVWGLDGRRVLEPSVGSGTFIEAARIDGYDIEWVTNELFPETSCFEPDFTEDFLQLEAERIGPIDLVVGNPPFSGRVSYRGVKTSLGFAFVLKVLNEHSTRAAFVLPPNVLRTRWLRLLPDDTRVVAWAEPEIHPYVLAGAGGGEEKEVKTAAALFERVGQPVGRTPWLGDIEIPGLTFVERYEEATHAVSSWGGVSLRALDGTLGRAEPYALEYPIFLTNPTVEALLSTGEISRHLARFSSGQVNITQEELVHLLNSLLKETRP